MAVEILEYHSGLVEDPEDLGTFVNCVTSEVSKITPTNNNTPFIMLVRTPPHETYKWDDNINNYVVGSTSLDPVQETRWVVL